MKIAKLNIEGYIGELDEKSVFAGEKNFTVNNLKTFLSNLSPDVTDIHYKVNSGGGSVYDGWEIHDDLKASGKTLTAIGEGMVGSIATIIYLAANPGNRKLINGTKFFVHNPYWLPESTSPMRADDLLDLGTDLRAEQDKILNFYAKESNATTEELAPFLEKETDLTAESAVRMGFANEVIDSIEDVEYHQYRLVAMIKPAEKQSKTNIMSETKKGMSIIKRLGLMMSRFSNGIFNNVNMPVIDGAGNNVTLYVETETEDLVGGNAFVISEDGTENVAPDDKYTDSEGKVIVVVSGVVDSVNDALAQVPNGETIDSLKAELEALKAEKAEMSTKLEASSAEGQVIKAQFETINTEFQALKTTLIGANAEFKNANQVFAKGVTVSGSDAGSAYAARLKSKIK